MHTRPTRFADGNDRLIRLFDVREWHADVAKVKANASAINFAIASVPVGPSEPVNMASALATLMWVKDVACIPVHATVHPLLGAINPNFPPPSSVEELDARCFIVKDGLCVTPVTETIAVRE